MRRTLTICALLLLTLAWASGVGAQVTIRSDYLVGTGGVQRYIPLSDSLRYGKQWCMRNDASDAGASQMSDSTGWIPTSKWQTLTVQSVAVQPSTFLIDSVGYSLLVRWSNDGIFPMYEETLSTRGITSGVSVVDSLHLRPMTYVKFLVWSWASASGGAPRAAATYVPVFLNVCAKGVK